MPFLSGVFGNGVVYLTPPASLPNGTRAYVYLLAEGEEPVSFYRRLVMIDPTDPRLYNHLGRAQFEAGTLDDAEASLNRAIQLDFSFAEAHFNLGRCLEAQGQAAAALSSFHKAADLSAEEVQYHRAYIEALIREEDGDAVLAALAAGLAAAPRLRAWAESDPALAPLRTDPRWAELFATE